MKRRDFLKWAGASVASGYLAGCADRVRRHPRAGAARPNILYILADDLGYGDVSFLNPEARIETAQLDRLARQSMVFTDAHSGSAVCTPTRYGVLTGRYCWRTRLERGVLDGYDGPLVTPDRLTVPKLLRRHGYASSCIGKWHLGWTWRTRDGAPPAYDPATQRDNIDYTSPISGGPLDAGFDYFYGINASLDMPPYVYVEDRRAVGTPAVAREFYPNREGMATADFEPVEVLSRLADKSIERIAHHAGREEPFFMYLALTAPHTPIVPTAAFQGRSGVNPYLDFVLETDHRIGQVVQALDACGLGDDTLVIVTSDNGYAPYVDLETLLEHGHHPSYIYRGYKADIFEGGHRVPFLARWPGRIWPSRNEATICLTDLLATVADIVGEPLPDAAGEDSVSMLGQLQQRPALGTRAAVVHHSYCGCYALRRGRWKLNFCPGSGGWSHPTPAEAAELDLPAAQLYDLQDDPAETHNLVAERPEIVRALTDLMNDYICHGRSTPGAAQPNNRLITLF